MGSAIANGVGANFVGRGAGNRASGVAELMGKLVRYIRIEEDAIEAVVDPCGNRPLESGNHGRLGNPNGVLGYFLALDKINSKNKQMVIFISG